MGRANKPSRKKDLQKARALIMQYKEHQEKVKNEPRSFALSHWFKEKDNFMSQARFYYDRAGVELKDVD
ncbi:MAG: hypothetical protein GYA24_14080 [Candidatus Lokiarchaeota archaeon]|nr:hypothetical protein [Candidatus Lokiarchaeota archaeon]